MTVTTLASAIPSDNDLYRAAQVLARQGQPVFPCSASAALHVKKAKAPLTRNGWQDASTDPAKIKAWWSRHRGAAIGTPTGVLWDVLDVDIKEEDGRIHLPYLQRVGLLNGCKKVVRSPSGGWHLYFKAAPSLNRIGSNKYIGLDFRGTGGYVVAPGSYIDLMIEQGYAGLYTDEGPTTDSTDEPLLWDLIVAAIRPVNTQTREPIAVLEAKRSASLGAIRQWLSGQTQQGDRNHSLFWATMRCIDNGIDPHELVEVALHIGLEEEEILTTVEQAMRRAGLTSDDLRTEAEVLFPDAQSA